MHSVVPHETGPSMDPASAQALERALALTIGQLQPRVATEPPAEPLPVAEAQEIDWAEWCEATAGSVGQLPTQQAARR
ncbi:MAG: hypothetical protein KGI91_05750 [Burkholderiales bacterium]|nr:hypothetical protein [Burkholderiales bacterium]MDE2076568.1 hypothetical protein [Burkholderiales bacterium]MDE2433064.1 hypothetical protein [Burkholderiales bacterium]